MKVLKAKKGYKYTQSELTELEDRIYAKVIYLSENDDIRNWKLIEIEDIP